MLVINQNSDVCKATISNYVRVHLLKLATDRVKVVVTCVSDCQTDTVEMNVFVSEVIDNLIVSTVIHFLDDMNVCLEDNDKHEYAITLSIVCS